MIRTPSPRAGFWLTLLAGTVAGVSGCTKVQLNNPHKLQSTASVVQIHLVSVNPPHGLTAGGTLLTLYGAGFAPGLSVTLGGSTCQNVTVISPTLLTCVAPSHVAGAVDVQLVPPSGSPLLLARAFTYLTSLPTLPGFAVTSGGGISTGAGMVVRASVGEVGSPAILTGGSVNLISGVHGAHFGP